MVDNDLIDLIDWFEVVDNSDVVMISMENIELVDILRDLDVTTLTPIEALNKLFELVKIANEGN